MIKIPATKSRSSRDYRRAGAGINVNVTLIFSVERYSEVISPGATESPRRSRPAMTRAASRASRHSSSRASTSRSTHSCPRGTLAADTAANAQAAAAYQLYRQRVAADDVTDLLARGAQVQRPLWASTSTKNPSYPDLLYVDRLGGRRDREHDAGSDAG